MGSLEEFIAGLGGVEGGTVRNNRWTCADCSDVGEATSEHDAATELYKHRMKNHVN